MQITYPVQVQWNLDETHPIIQTFIALSVQDQTALLNSMMDQFTSSVNERGTWATFTITKEAN